MYIAAIWRVVRGANEASFARDGVRHLRRAACASLAHGALEDAFAADHPGILPAFPFFAAPVRPKGAGTSWVDVTALKRSPACPRFQWENADASWQLPRPVSLKDLSSYSCLSLRAVASNNAPAGSPISQHPPFPTPWCVSRRIVLPACQLLKPTLPYPETSAVLSRRPAASEFASAFASE